MSKATERVEVPDVLKQLWGSPELPRDAGVLHVVATWSSPASPEVRRVIRITEQSPRSPTDFFVLNLARARADAILTTGRILREEPALRVDLQGTHARALADWRDQVLGRPSPPQVLVLTSGAGVSLDHPVFRGWARPVVMTSKLAASGLRPEAARRGIEVVGLDVVGPRATLAWARDHGARTISVEAGPTTATQLYSQNPIVEELLLSEFLEPDLAEELRGPVAFAPGELDPVFGAPLARATRAEPSGQWRFSRLRRRPAAPPLTPGNKP